MTKFEQMKELIKKFQEDQEFQKEVAALLQSEKPEDTTMADQWLADNGYKFTLMELIDHLEDESDLTAEELEAVAGGKADEAKATASTAVIFVTVLGVGIGAMGGAEACEKIQG